MIRMYGGQATLGANTFTGAQVAPSLALGGATIGTNALAVTGTASFGGASSSNATTLNISGTSLSSTAQLFTRLTPTINQASGTYTVLDINPTETSIGAGPHYLIRGRLGAGSDVFSVDRAGNVSANSYSTSGTLAMLGGQLRAQKRTDPAAPSANEGLLYLRDNGSGKMQFVARFPTGAIQVIATEP